MTRLHADPAKDHFDLLPFIAILMCILGCLLLVTMSMAALSMGPAAGEGWIPTRDSRRPAKIPVLIEWDGTELVVHRETRREEIKWVGFTTIEFERQTLALKRGADEQIPALSALLDELEAKRETHYALFAVRPSGFDQFNLMASEFRSRKTDIGYEPIAQTKTVRLFSEQPDGSPDLTQP